MMRKPGLCFSQLPKTIRLPLLAIILLVSGTCLAVNAQDHRLTPLQLEIEKQRERLNSADMEERREALARLRSLRHPEASRVALSALDDQAAIVRATAAASLLSLPADESAAALRPLLNDKEEFVRQQVAYALGEIRSRVAVPDLIERLADKRDSVRGAAAVALGQIGDASAAPALISLLAQTPLPSSKKQKTKAERNVFVTRAAAHSLGQLGNRAAVPALIAVLQNVKASDDVRREAAIALGAISDPSALPALRENLIARDPYLAAAAHEAVKRISRSPAAPVQ